MKTPCLEIANTLSDLFICTTTANGFSKIRTPFLYPDGDVIDIYIHEQGSQRTLTDFGDTLGWLKSQTIAKKKTDKQEALLQDVCLTHGIENYRGMFCLRIDDSTPFADQVIRFSQALVRISDIWFTFKTRSYESIVEEVAEFLVDLKVPFEQNEKIKGRSGRTRHIDFHTRLSQRSTFIDVLSTGSKAAANSKVDSVVATWYDLNHVLLTQQGIKFISLFDDTLDIWSPANIQQLEDISEVAYWSRPESLRALVIPEAA
jgi:hypothetical protein